MFKAGLKSVRKKINLLANLTKLIALKGNKIHTEKYW
ncbi:hypothetical protein ACVW2L_001594 [Mucilaginibacter sp. HD30]